MKNETIGADELYLAPEETENLEVITLSDDNESKDFDEASSDNTSRKSKKPERLEEIIEKRGNNLKVFRMNDGTEQAVFSSSPIHIFNNESRTFEKIENTFTEDNDGRHFIGGKNNFIAKFSREDNNDDIFSIEKGIHKVTVCARKNKKNRNKGVKPTLRRIYNEDSDVSDILTFSEIEANADYEYSTENDGVKENIIVKKKSEIYRYPFLLKCENVSVNFDEKENRIAFLSNENGEEVFFIPAPFMTDANGITSTNVYYDFRDLENGTVAMAIIADREFINSEDRAFPVIIDPQIKLSGTEGMTTYSWENGSMTSSSTHTVGTTGSGDGCCNAKRMYITLNIPTLPNNPRIKKAELIFKQSSKSTSDSGCCKFGLYHVTEDIRTGSYEPNNDSNLIDYANISTKNVGTIQYSFDITSLVDQAVNKEISKHNLVMKMLDEACTSKNTVTLYGNSYSNVYYKPELTITYESSYGVNTSYRTHTHELGRFGQGSVDLQCGNLMFESEDFAWSGNRMPVTIKHLFNSALAGYTYTNNSAIKLSTAVFSAMKLGYGFKLNLMQSMVASTFVHEGTSYFGYVYVGENGEETFFKKSETQVCCDSNSQCYNLFEDVNGGDMLYDPEKRTLKQGEDTYQFDVSGRLIKISDATEKNHIVITYASNRITSVTDGAGREFSFTYNTNGQLLSIVAPDLTAINYTYTGYLLTGISYPDGKKAVIAYSSNKPTSVTLQDANGTQVYKVAYSFSGNRLYSVTEYGSDNSIGAKSTYSYSVASARTLVTTTEQKDTDEGETANNVITTTYTFDDDGNIVSEYVYSTDTGKVGGDGEESGINPHSGDGGAGIVSNINNLLTDHNFESLTSWSEMPANCGDLYISNYAHESYAKFGKKVLRMQSYNADCGENGVYQVTNTLPKGQYTFSAYLRVLSAFSGTDAGAFIRVTDTAGNVLGVSEHLVKYDSEYTRLIVPFELAKPQSVHVQILVNGKGTVYADAAQLENNPYANAYNMLENGNFERGTSGWTCSSGVYYTTGTCFNMSKSLYMNGSIEDERTAYQDVIVKTASSTRETFTLSGWAKGYGLPNHDRVNVEYTPKFRLCAIIRYNDNSTQTETANFSPCTEEWQFASVQFAKNTYRTVKNITVYCDYSHNSGTVYFDDVHLVRNSIETDLSSGDFSESSIISNTSNTSGQLLDNTPQFNEVMDIYGNVLTNTIYNDGEYGTIYRSYGFTPDCNNPENSGNDLIRETDPRGSKTLYTVDEDTSRCEEIIDRCDNKIAYEYDNVGRITKICNKNNLDVELSSVSCKYDSLDTITEIYRKDEMKYTFSYNPFHNLESIGIFNKPENLISCYYKNGNGRIKKITYANDDFMKISYNSVGQIVSETWHKDNVEIARYKYVYDSTGNVVRSIDINRKKEYNYIYDNKLLTSAKEYDVIFENDLVTSKTLVNVINYVYNKFGQVIQKTITDCGDSTFTYYYDYTDGRIVSKFFVNGLPITSHSKIDKLGRKEFDELQLSTGFVSRKYSYYAGKATPEHKLAKNLKSVATTQLVSQIALSDGRAISYEYDDEERIIKVDDTIDGVVEYTYDALGQIETETRDGVTTKFEYNNYGNITAKGEVNENCEIAPATKISYAYDNDAWKDLLTSYNGQAIEYDAQGNPVKYLGHTLEWEKGRQLKKFDNIEYTYNANGIRTSKKVNGVLHTYTLDGTKILRETWGSNTLVPLYDNEDSVCGIIYNDVPYYFIKNLQDDIIAIVDSKENVIANYTYDAWGKIISVNGENVDIANINPFRYRGYYYDTEIDMYYLQSRYYDAETGRFINADVAEYVLNTHSPISSNLFTYCYNTPVNGVDTFGFCGTTFRPVYRYTPTKKNSTNNSKIDYSNDNWIAKFLGVKTKFTTGFDVLGASFKLTLSAQNASSGIKITKDSFTYNFSSGSLSLGWNGKLEGGFGLSFGRYSISYLQGIDWQKSYLAVSISCTSKDGKREFECELYFSMSHLLKLTIAVLVVGACVVIPALAPVCTSFASIITTAAKSIYPILTGLIPMFEQAARNQTALAPAMG